MDSERFEDWLIPEWPAPSGVHAICTTRLGGVSAAPYDALNLGAHVGDAPASVTANRTLLRQAIGARPVFMEQVHGTRLAALRADSVDGLQGDACFTTQRSLACTIMVADCLPVLITDATGNCVAAAHAGWRGLAGGVLEGALAAFGAAGRRPDVLAWLGPCIGRDAFEVGDEVKAAFEATTADAALHFEPAAQGKWKADLAGLARRRLFTAGVTQVHGNDGSEVWCTVHNPLRFFSHRRDRISGRFAACIWRG